jgi:hypothetical protein
MPAFQIKLKCEVNVGADLESQLADMSKVKALVDAVKSQSLSPEALAVLTSASNLQIETKMLGRAAKTGTTT